MLIVYTIHLTNRTLQNYLTKEINWQVSYIILTFFSLIICYKKHTWFPYLAMLNNIISTLGNARALTLLLESNSSNLEFAMSLSNGMIRNIIWHIPASLENCLLADFLLMFCFFYRYICLEFYYIENFAPVITFLLIVIYIFFLFLFIFFYSILF